MGTEIIGTTTARRSKRGRVLPNGITEYDFERTQSKICWNTAVNTSALGAVPLLKDKPSTA